MVKDLASALFDDNLLFIEIICISAKLVISSKISPEFDGVPITDFLPKVQLSVLIGKFHIQFVYLTDFTG